MDEMHTQRRRTLDATGPIRLRAVLSLLAALVVGLGAGGCADSSGGGSAASPPEAALRVTTP